MYYRMFSDILDLYPLDDASSTPLQVVTMKTVSRCYQVSPEGHGLPTLRTTALEENPKSLIYKDP